MTDEITPLSATDEQVTLSRKDYEKLLSRQNKDDLTCEITCWRVWNYLRAHGQRDIDNVRMNVGATETQFESALSVMQELGTVRVDAVGRLELMAETPPFTAVFPTISQYADNL